MFTHLPSHVASPTRQPLPVSLATPSLGAASPIVFVPPHAMGNTTANTTNVSKDTNEILMAGSCAAERDERARRPCGSFDADGAQSGAAGASRRAAPIGLAAHSCGTVVDSTESRQRSTVIVVGTTRRRPMRTILAEPRNLMRRLPWLVLAIVAAGCGSTGSGDGGRVDGQNDGTSDGTTSMEGGTDLDGGDGGPRDGSIDALDPAEAVSLAVDPTMATLRITNLAMPQRQMYTARARTRDGRDVIVPATWSVDRTDVVSIAADGVATTTNASGGDVVVTARYGALSATAMLRVVLEVTVMLPGTPPGTDALFPPGAMPTADAMRTAAWLYPSNETIFPQNVYKILFQWRPFGNDRFRINVESDRTRLALFTDGVHATCTAARTGMRCFEPTIDVWRFIAASNPRANVTVTIDAALSTAPGRFTRSAPLTIGFSRGPVPGAIYYWSTTARGVRRATVSDSAPTNFLTPDQADGDCVACHTLSRQGNRLGADVGGERLWLVEVSPRFPPPRIVTAVAGAAIPCSWNTISWDETRVVTATRGAMTLRRATDGTSVNVVPMPATRFGTQPDWAPDSSLLAFVISAANRDRGVEGGQIATIEIRPGDTWGMVRTLVGRGMRGDTNMFPSFSWDSQWIAYAHSTGNGQNDITTDLWLMQRDGTAPRALTRANTIVNSVAVTTATIQDNMPTWAPSGVPDDYAWVAFSSTRAYGAILAAGSALGEREQLWVAAIDLTRTTAGADPSAPAFRLPVQDLDEDTHRPFWAQDRVRPDPDAGVDASIDVPVPDVVDAGRADAMCAARGADCTRNPCCGALICWDDGTGAFTCTDTPM